MPRRALPDPVTWLSDKISEQNNDNHTISFYEKFQFKNLIASVGDYVLISNADSAEPDTEEGCDAAKILSLYENREKKSDPFRAKVQWYTKPSDLPNWVGNSAEVTSLSENEVVEDHRPFDTDVSIETFFRKCNITLAFTNSKPDEVLQGSNTYHYVCRYRLTALSKRKVTLEPVLEQERKARELLCTPKKDVISSKSATPKTPNSLVKRMSRVSLSETKNWSVSKADGTKLLLKRAILADKTEKDSPKKSTPIKTTADTPRSSKKIAKNNIGDIISMELEENSDDEIPTLIIRQHTPSTPKRKAPLSNITNETPKKNLHFDDVKETQEKSTRSGRTVRQPTNYYEEEVSPVKRTPRKSIRVRQTSEGSDDFKPKAETPKTPRTPRTPCTPRTPRTPRANAATPRSVKRRIITSQLTPSLHNRADSVDHVAEISKETKSLPGRESQLEEILSFVRSKLLENGSGCMYISGVPGTGKTATVCTALKMLQDESGLPDFQLVQVNGMRIAEPRQAYVQIYKQLTGKTLAWEQACSLLEKRFTNAEPRRTPTVLLVDELDALCTRRQDVLYSIVEWAAQRSARLSVLAVANTMDLPERALAARVASRLGLTRLTFPPYSHAQLRDIVATRLSRADVSADALQLIARKVAAVSGDARRALALTARALELAAGEGAGLAHVQRALAEAASGAAAAAVRNCSAAERLMLQAVASEVERTGSEETSLSRALQAAGALAALSARPYRLAARAAPEPAQAWAICARLSSMKLLLMEPRAEPRLLLNVSPDDIHYATRDLAV